MKIEDALGTQHGPFGDYIKGKSVVIADTSSAARASLAQILQSLGANLLQLNLASSYREAAEEIRRTKPKLVIADFDIGKRCGLDLVHEQREAHVGKDSDRSFLVVASNTSHSAVARAAEEDVDAYIVRPYSLDAVRRVLHRLAAEKLRPADYATAIARGKARILDNDLAGAEREFGVALTLNPAPTLAYYYLGQVKAMRKLHDEAMSSYTQGLEFNRIHFKCNVGVYDLHMSLRRYTDAYEIIKRISQVFPSNPKRFAEVLRLAVITANYQDIEPYYQVFCDMEDREEHLVRHVCAALVVCGRHFLTTNKTEQAIKAYQRAWIACRGRTGMLREIVQSLLEFRLTAAAKAFVMKTPPGAQGSRDFLISRFLVIDSEGDLEATIGAGRELVASGVADELVFEVLIRRSLQAGLESAVDSLTMKAIARYPAKRDHFLGIADPSVLGS